jgi:hypothetical protein
MRIIKYISIAFVSLAAVFTADFSERLEFPVYRVVLDPGHGGIAMADRKRHGDRYDSISRSYLQDFKEGAANAGLEEHAIVYSIAKKVEAILVGCSPGGNFSTFHPLLERYSDKPWNRISIECFMSRGRSISREDEPKRKDPNAPFRVFDFPGENGTIRPGRVSYINSLCPQLVVSLHITNRGAAYYRGMNPVIAAPYSFMYRGLLYLKGIEKSRDFFFSGPYRDWFDESDERTGFEWFLNDAVLYFTGYTLNGNRTVNRNGFRGYRYNMVRWNYRDAGGWEEEARAHPAYTQYSSELDTFAVRGKFWEREQSDYEVYRREGGNEGYGGDNHYASAEIIRYILLSLEKRNLYHPDQRPGRPYISVWHIPLHVNAINAFLELGYLSRPWHRYLLTHRQDEIAEGVAVGIYSLLAGLEPREGGSRFTPKGKRIDLGKYSSRNTTSYFNMARPE